MKKSFHILLALIISLFTVSFGSSVFADGKDIADGEYELNIKALEANEDKDSVADGFINEEATLNVSGDDLSITIGVAKGGEGDGEFGDFDFSIDWVKVEGNEHIKDEDAGTETNYTFPLNEIKEILNAEMKYAVAGFPGLEDGHEVAFRIQIKNYNELPEATDEDGNDEGNGEGNGNDEGNGKENDNGEGNNDDGDNNDNNDVDNNDNNDDQTNNDEENDAANNNDNDNNKENNNVVDQDDDEDNPKTGDSSNILLYTILLVVSASVAGFILRKRFA